MSLSAKLIINVPNPYYGNVSGAYSRVTVEKLIPYDPLYKHGKHVEVVLNVPGSSNPNQLYDCEVRGKSFKTDTNTGNTLITYNLTDVS